LPSAIVVHGAPSTEASAWYVKSVGDTCTSVYLSLAGFPSTWLSRTKVFLFPTTDPPVSYSLSPKLLMPYSVYAFAVSS
jgi:hypothetical protein